MPGSLLFLAATWTALPSGAAQELTRAYRYAVAAGTFVASYIAKHHRQRMRGCVLIDPVCLGMFMPNLIYNFLYKQPVWKGWGKRQ